MKPENIYELTRIKDAANLTRLERQMSGRRNFLNVKSWEIEGLRSLVDNLKLYIDNVAELKFFYSFLIPKLGKEFDLLRISADTVINIELKSRPVSDTAVKKQLETNRYYLANLGRNMRSYTYISSQNRLLRLTNKGRLIESDWETLCGDISGQKSLYEDDLEELFNEEKYIISPLANPDRFLSGEYFLTSQQRDFEKKILRRIKTSAGPVFQGIMGLPGTGKTLLLYDIAMKLSENQRVCILHCGAISDALRQLDSRLKRIDFYQGCDRDAEDDFGEYAAVLVDEAHRMPADVFDRVVSLAGGRGIPVVFSYDCEDAISAHELEHDFGAKLSKLNDYVRYRLTNRIRANAELSSFIQCVMQGQRANHRKDYPGVELSYANDEEEARTILLSYVKRGYTYIYDSDILPLDTDAGKISAADAPGREFDRVIMVMDEQFFYDEQKRELRSRSGKPNRLVRNLFCGLNRAKKGLAILVINNEEVLDALLTIVQGYVPERHAK